MRHRVTQSRLREKSDSFMLVETSPYLQTASFIDPRGEIKLVALFTESGKSEFRRYGVYRNALFYPDNVTLVGAKSCNRLQF